MVEPKVRFRETIEQMYADGVRHFVEVGPSGNLTAFVNDVLAGKERCALATNLRRRNGVEQLLTVLAELYASGKPVDVGAPLRRTRLRADCELRQHAMRVRRVPPRQHHAHAASLGGGAGRVSVGSSQPPAPQAPEPGHGRDRAVPRRAGARNEGRAQLEAEKDPCSPRLGVSASWRTTST